MDGLRVGMGGVHDRPDALFLSERDHPLFIETSGPPGDPRVVADIKRGRGRHRDEDRISRFGEAGREGGRFTRAANQ